MQAGSVPGFQVPESYGLVDGAGCEDGLTHANVKAGNLRRVKRHQKQLELCLQAIHTDSPVSVITEIIIIVIIVFTRDYTNVLKLRSFYCILAFVILSFCPSVCFGVTPRHRSKALVTEVRQRFRIFTV